MIQTVKRRLSGKKKQSVDILKHKKGTVLLWQFLFLRVKQTRFCGTPRASSPTAELNISSMLKKFFNYGFISDFFDCFRFLKTCFPLWGMLSRERERWQTKSDGEGASAAEAKWLLQATRAKDERGLALEVLRLLSIVYVSNLYRQLR